MNNDNYKFNFKEVLKLSDASLTGFDGEKRHYHMKTELNLWYRASDSLFEKEEDEEIMNKIMRKQMYNNMFYDVKLLVNELETRICDSVAFLNKEDLDGIMNNIKQLKKELDYEA